MAPPSLSSLPGLSLSSPKWTSRSHSRPRPFVSQSVRTRLADPPSALPSLFPELFGLGENGLCLLIPQAGFDLSHPFG